MSQLFSNPFAGRTIAQRQQILSRFERQLYSLFIGAWADDVAEERVKAVQHILAAAAERLDIELLYLDDRYQKYWLKVKRKATD